MTFNPLAKPPAGSFASKVEAARKAREDADAVALSKTDQISEAAKEFSFSPPEFATEALGIVFDNSSSMAGQKVVDARDGTEEFMRACTPNETAIKVIPLNNGGENNFGSTRTKIDSRFSCDLPALALDLPNIHAEGGTPLYEAIQNNLEPSVDQPKVRIRRMVVFSDGEPNHSYEPFTIEQTISKVQEKKVILDTVLIANRGFNPDTDAAYKVMKRLAEETGGYFLVFERGKVNFKDAFKYLSPTKRYLLADNDFRKALQEGTAG